MAHPEGSQFLLQQLVLHLEPDQTPKLALGSIDLEYVAEGAANLIFAIRVHTTYLGRYDNAYILRLRKDLAFTVPTAQAIQEFQERIAPLFAQQSWILTPVKLALDAGNIDALNGRLRWMENHGQRWPESRHGVYLPDISHEPYAILLPNLYRGEGTVVEFKPKWLLQSPSALRDAVRCRTCALNLMRRAEGHARGRGDSGVCPLDLLSDDTSILVPALKALWKDATSLNAFVAAFKTTVQPVLHHLRYLQNQNNRVGLEDFLNPERLDFSVAMALRDCSIFLKAVEEPSSNTINISLVKILDLDLKQTSGGKIEKWARMEQQLLDGGWYTKLDDSHYHQCALSSTGSSG